MNGSMILCYHHIVEVDPPHTLLAKLASGNLRVRLAAVTFDDGYADNYEIGFPTLRRLGIPATIYLAAGYIDSGMPFWMDRLSWLLSPHAGEVLPASQELTSAHY